MQDTAAIIDKVSSRETPSPFAAIRTDGPNPNPKAAFVGTSSIVTSPIIVAPALQTLNVCRNPDGNVTWILERIAIFPALTNLSLANGTWDSGSLLSTLRSLPHLTSLDLAEDTKELIITKALLSGLTRGGVDVEGVRTPSNPQCPLPNMVSMRILLCKPEWSDTYESPLVVPLCMMALSRRRGAADGEDLRALEIFDARYKYSGVKDAKPILAWGDGN